MKRELKLIITGFREETMMPIFMYELKTRYRLSVAFHAFRRGYALKLRRRVCEPVSSIFSVPILFSTVFTHEI